MHTSPAPRPPILHRRFGQFDGFIEHHNGEPCVIFRAAQAKSGSQAWGVGLSNLHLYFQGKDDPRPSMPTPYAFAQAKDAAIGLGFDDVSAMKKLLDALYEMVDELVKAPPELLFPEEKPKGSPKGSVEIVNRRTGEHLGSHEYH